MAFDPSTATAVSSSGFDPDTATPVKGGESVLKKTGREVAGAADFVTSAPQFIASLAGRLTSTPVEMARGALGMVGPDESSDPYQRAEDKVNKLVAPLSSNIEDSLFGTQGTSGAKKLGSAVGEGVEWLSDKASKVGISPAAVRMATDELMALGIPGSAKVGKALGDRLARPDSADLAAERSRRQALGYGEQPVNTTDSLIDSFKKTTEEPKPIDQLSTEQQQELNKSTTGGTSVRNIAPAKISDLRDTPIEFQPSGQRELGLPEPDQLGELNGKGDAITENPASPNALAVQDYWRKALDQSGINFDSLPDEVKGQLALDLQQKTEGAASKIASDKVTDRLETLDKQIAELHKTLAEYDEAYKGATEGKRTVPMSGVGGSQGGAIINPADAAIELYKAGGDMVKKAKEIFDEHGEAAARIFIQTYQDQKQGENIASKPKSVQLKELADNLYTLGKQRTVDSINGDRKLLHGIMPEAQTEAAYHSRPTEKDFGKSSIPEAATKQLDQLSKENADLYREASLLEGKKLPADLDPHNTRSIAKRGVLEGLASFGTNVMAGGGFSRKADTMRGRSMFAIESPSGERRVVNIDGNQIKGYDSSKKQIETPLYKVDKSADAEVGKQLPDGNKIVQATTKEIEDQTEFKYNKNAARNEIRAGNQLKAYIRETKFLRQLIPSLEKEGYMVNKESVVEPPKGFVSVKGHPTLERYYIDPRFAAIFEDSVLHGGPEGSIVHGLEVLNSAAVGTMFWNPEPHLFNAFDHYVNTIGWDFFKPWQYPSITKAMYNAFRDVAEVNENYIKYMKEGWGLQYGEVKAQQLNKAALEKMAPAEIESIAKRWGMKGPELISAIYDKSKTALWGGSDIFMIAAREHLASKKGMDVFNKALGDYVEAHNPNYRVPANIGFDSLMKIPGMQEAIAATISRNLSKMMQSRAFNTFGRYHYGQFRSIGSNLHDLVLQNEKTVQTKGQALANLAFTAFNVGVVYPFVWDQLAKMMVNDPTAEQRRSGASTIPYTLWHMALGDEQVTKLISEAYSLPPITKDLIELPSNRQLFTGNHIWEPADSFAGKAYETSKYLTGSLVAPIKQAQDIMAGKGKQVLESQVGIKTTTPQKEGFKKKLEKTSQSRVRKLERERGF